MNAIRINQLVLPFSPPKETQAERCRRILAGNPGRVVRPASELQFDYQAATRIAQQGNQRPEKTKYATPNAALCPRDQVFPAI